jgi:hypothetical protein
VLRRDASHSALSHFQCSGQPDSGNFDRHVRLTSSRHGTMVLKYTPAPSELATALTCRSSGRGHVW